MNDLFQHVEVLKNFPAGPASSIAKCRQIISDITDMDYGSNLLSCNCASAQSVPKFRYLCEPFQSKALMILDNVTFSTGAPRTEPVTSGTATIETVTTEAPTTEKITKTAATTKYVTTEATATDRVTTKIATTKSVTTKAPTTPEPKSPQQNKSQQRQPQQELS
jgi:hypothetical protein